MGIKSFRTLFVVTVALFGAVGAAARSFVYIQSDPALPIYVKLDGKMLPRYGKTYCIIPNLDAGPVQVEILFQQNLYPAQKFTVKVPTSGHRGFYVTRRDGAFFLYDLQQNFYLPAGAGADADRLPSAAAVASATPAAERPAASTPAASADPRFISGVELPTPSSERPTASATTPRRTTRDIRNSDCPAAMSERDFQRFYEDALEQAGAEDRVGWMLDKLDNRCLSTDQVKLLARSLDGDAARYTFLKRAYARTSDQGRYPDLEALLVGSNYRTEFRTLVGR